MRTNQLFLLIMLNAMCRLRRFVQHGYVTVEYTIVTASVIVALLLPIPGVDESIVDMTISAIKQFQAHTVTLLALP